MDLKIQKQHRNGPGLSRHGISASQAIVMLLALSVAAPLAATALHEFRQTPSGADGVERFAITSIRPAKSGRATSLDRHFVLDPDGRVSLEMPMLVLVSTAYGIDRGRIVGAPDWARQARFAIDAEPPAGSPVLGRVENRKRFLAMLRALLADRFQLAAHFENRQVPVYELVKAIGGSKFPPPANPGEPPPVAGVVNPKNPNLLPEAGAGDLSWGISGVHALADFLGSQLGRPVVDKTGLADEYTIHLIVRRDAGPGVDPVPAGSHAAGVISALKQQLGLTVRSAKDPIRFLVITRIARPSPN
jgi:uncharacterized protein (TIGR03435 family)